MLRIAALIQAGVTLVGIAVLLVLRESDHRRSARRQRDALLGPGRRIAGFGAEFFARGFLAAGGSFASTRAPGARGQFAAAVPVAVAIGIADGSTWSARIAVAPLICLAVLPFALRRYRPEPGPAAAADAGVEFTLARGAPFRRAVLLMMHSEHPD